jgi:hypothetical protein
MVRRSINYIAVGIIAGLATSGISGAHAAEITVLTLPTNDIIYDPGTRKIYASVPSVAGPGIGNTITAIDPVTRTIGASTFMGSEPGKLARSDNGQYLYAGLDGAAAIRRYDVASGTAGAQFALGLDSFYGPLFAEDIEVLPGAPDSVAVSRFYEGVSPRHAGVAIYDNGVKRAVTTPTHTGSNVIEFSETAATLYGYNTETTDFGLRTMTVDASGVTVTNSVGNLISGFGTDIKFDDGLLYASSGRVVDPDTSTLVGTYTVFDPFSTRRLVEPDSARGLTYFLEGSFFGGQTTGKLRTFDLDTFVPLGELEVAGIAGDVGSLIRWGDDGLAFRTTGGQVFLIDPDPVPVPAAVWLLGSGMLGLIGMARRKRSTG